MTQTWAEIGPRGAVRTMRGRWRRLLVTRGRRIAAHLPTPAARTAQRLAVAIRLVRPHPMPLVSIVVPIHQVENYLAECLDSVISQTYDNLQIVLVDDGSPDGCLDIMTAYARHDSRIEIVRQPNKGVAAARNAGVAVARGTYLMFADPDDVMSPEAVATHVESLEHTRSDFSVAPYRRFSQAGHWPAGWWITRAHAARHDRILVTDHPDIQVNAVVWSKCFRRRFWQQRQISFPEGVLYEDQHVSSRCYAVGRFDVLTKPVYGWRVRENQSSITQQIACPAGLRERLGGARHALAALSAPQLKEARDARLVQILQHDLHGCVRAAQHADDEYWRVLRRGLQALTAGVDDALWARISVQQRIGIRLVLEDLRAETIWFTGLGRSNPKRNPSLAAGGQLYLDTPARHILGVEPTHPDLAFADHQLGLITSIRRLRWTEQGRLQIGAWAYLDNVSLGDPETPVEIRVWAEARRGTSTVAQVPLAVTSTPSAEVTTATGHRYADYERSVFEAEIDPRALIHAPGVETSTWHIMVEVDAAGIRRSGPLREPYRGGSAERPTARFVEAHEVVPRYGPGRDLRLSAKLLRCVVESAELADGELSVRVRGRAGFEPDEIEIAFPGDGERLRHPLGRLADGSAGGTIPLSRRSPSAPDDSWLRQARVRVVSRNGHRAPAAVLDPAVLGPAVGDEPADGPTTPIRRTAGGLRVARTSFGNLSVSDERRTVRVRQVEVLPDHRLVVTGVLTDLEAAELTIGLTSPTTSSWAQAESTGDSGFVATIALEHDLWGLGRTPLPTGDYALVARGRSAEDRTGTDETRPTTPVTVLIEQPVAEQLSVVSDTGTAQVRIRQLSRRRLQVRLSPPLTDVERGGRQQQRLQTELRRRLTRPRSESRSVLFRSNFGEIAGCNQLAVHRELVRRGGGFRLYWAVKDHSVQVPDGGIPVIHESAEWYRLLHEAEFYLDNMHQPIYHRKPAHQVQVQTFHGYPFKQMGRRNWVRQQREAAHVESYLERAEDWDFMVSPARYATQPLCEAFGFSNEVLEIGYPRNDTLLHPCAPQVSSDVRKRLGIHPDQTAILYAPTFREELAKDDFRAAMVDFLDLNRVVSALGPAHVLLVRGHAFNARRSERVRAGEQVIDVTDYPDVTELMLASDAAILDYSSLRFDYGLTGKPMIFLVPDMESYVSSSRGAIMPYEPTAPGPLLRTTDEVISAVLELPRIERDWATARATFREQFLDLDDGHAAERLVDRVFFS